MEHGSVDNGLDDNGAGVVPPPPFDGPPIGAEPAEGLPKNGANLEHKKPIITIICPAVAHGPPALEQAAIAPPNDANAPQHATTACVVAAPPVATMEPWIANPHKVKAITAIATLAQHHQLEVPEGSINLSGLFSQ